MSNVRYTPPTEIRSAVWLMLNVLSLAVISLRDRFGISPCTPLLPRHVLSSLSSFLAQAEPALRRCLYLSAAELGALPALDRSGASPTLKSAKGNPPRNARSSATPVFRLFETGSGRKDASPPPKTFRTGPRIRFLDGDDTPDIHEYDARSDDILPARALVRRLAAMDHALDHRDVYIRKLRRTLGAARLPSCNARPHERSKQKPWRSNPISIHPDTNEIGKPAPAGASPRRAWVLHVSLLRRTPAPARGCRQW